MKPFFLTLPDHPFDYTYLMDRLKAYRSPRSKITRMLQQQEIIRVKKGLYVLAPEYGGNIDPLVLSNLIYGPSYVSLESALSYWGMIPERVEEVTCMTNKRNKLFETPVGRFSYHYLNNRIFPIGRKQAYAGNLCFLMASREKALCDKLATLPLTTEQDIAQLLEFDLRVDLEASAEMDCQLLKSIQTCYKNQLVSRFVQWYLQTHSNSSS